MDLEKIIREFLAVIDFELCSIANNGIDSFNLRIIKDNEKDGFYSELSNNDSLYINSIGKIMDYNFVSYRKIDNNGIIINVSYAVDGNNRSLEMSSNFCKKNDRKLCIKEYINNDQHGAVLMVKENNQEFYKQEIKSNEIDNYFQALVYRLKAIIEPSNNAIRTLNNNIFEMIFHYYNIGTEFLNMIDNSISSNEIIDCLFEKYFGNIPLNKKIETEISYQKTLTLPSLRKNISKNE